MLHKLTILTLALITASPLLSAYNHQQSCANSEAPTKLQTAYTAALVGSAAIAAIGCTYGQLKLRNPQLSEADRSFYRNIQYVSLQLPLAIAFLPVAVSIMKAP